jgi:acyl-CoA hydrolase
MSPGNRTPDAVPISTTRMSQSRLMLPTDANIYGNVHGGVIVKYLDEMGGTIAARHARANAVTASIDRMHFYKPAFIGNLLIFKGAINYVGKKSMEVGIKVYAEDIQTGIVTHTGSVYLTFVALDENGKPLPVAPVYPETPEEEHWHEGAKERRKRRLDDLKRRLERKQREAKQEKVQPRDEEKAGTGKNAREGGRD